jgi:glycolate dehydrogenase FAD-binding subunit
VPTALADKLRSIAGSPHVLTGVECSPYVLEGRAPEAVVFPGSKEEVAAVLGLAADAEVPVIPWGGGTRLGTGSPPARLGLVIGLKRLDRILEHVPGDLTATVEAGITLGALQSALGKQGQWLSLDPAYPERATLGGILASNASGPRRHLYGTCRDLLIGLTVVGADGSIVHGGGKVVKNVAGYDLPKLYVGSFGTLGILVEATLKLRPRPDEDRLVIARFERFADGGAAARAIMASDLIPSALDLVDGEAARALGWSPAGGALLIGVDGIREQVEWQCGEIARLLQPLAASAPVAVDGPARDQVWRGLGELGRAGMPDVAAIMRWGVLPTRLPELMENGAAIARRNSLRAALAAHAGVGIATAVLAGRGADADATVKTLDEWRGMVDGAGGHAILEWAPLGVKERVAVWDEPGPALRLMKALKDHLDPRGILNPGRFVGGI